MSVELVNKHKSNLKLLCLHSIRSGFHISPWSIVLVIPIICFNSTHTEIYGNLLKAESASAVWCYNIKCSPAHIIVLLILKGDFLL